MLEGFEGYQSDGVFPTTAAALIALLVSFVLHMLNESNIMNILLKI